MRIVSLVPAGTAMVAALGPGLDVVGRTRQDRTPAAGAATVVGDVLTPSLERIASLRPDVVLAWGGLPDARLRRLAGGDAEVVALDLRRLEDVGPAWIRVGAAVGRPQEARRRAHALAAALDAVRRRTAGRDRPAVLAVVSDAPPVVAGPGTFLDDLIDVAGGRNAFRDAPSPWLRPSLEALAARSPDLVLWAVPGRPAGPRQASPWAGLWPPPHGRIVPVDADLFQEPGPRVAEAARRLALLVHPDLASAGSRRIRP